MKGYPFASFLPERLRLISNFGEIIKLVGNKFTWNTRTDIRLGFAFTAVSTDTAGVLFCWSWVPKNEPHVTAVTKCRMMWNSLRRRAGCNLVRRVLSFPSPGARERDPGKGWSLVSQNLGDDKTTKREEMANTHYYSRLASPSLYVMFCHLPDSGRHVTSVFQGLSLSFQGTGRRGPWERGCVACRTSSYPVHQNLSPWLR